MSFEQQLEGYARLAVRVGLNLQPGQKLLIRAPLEAAPLVQAIAREAYRAGSSLVVPVYTDDAVNRIRLEEAGADTLETVTSMNLNVGMEMVESGGAYLGVIADDPAVFAGLDPARIATVQRANTIHNRPLLEQVGAYKINWSLVSYAIPARAKRLFPNLPIDEAMKRTWDAIFTVTRADQPDPVAAWQAHLKDLLGRQEFLNRERFDALHFRAPGTDLMVGLVQDHLWESGSSATPSGISFVANMPTDEVFTMPHRLRVNGTARASKPLSYSGVLIEGIEVRFQDGAVVEAKASANEAAFLKLLETDEGARRIGEVALVANSAPVARTGLVFEETLYDENAACHIALGRAYPTNIKGGVEMSPETALEAGMNDSATHVDWMIGSGEMDVDGVKSDGARVPILRAGEWAFTP